MKDHVWIPSRDQRLSSMLHMPAVTTKDTPIVVCCHGFTGDKIGFNHLTLNLAKVLENTGYIVLRFDYLGSGDSDGDFSVDTTVAGWKKDLNNVLEWIKKQPQLSLSPIILYGHSLGGLVVLTHNFSDQTIAGRIVFAPVINPIENFREVILGQALWKKSLMGETIANFYGKGFKLEGQLVRDLVDKNYDPVKVAAMLTTPLLIVHGLNDNVVPFQGSQYLYQKYTGPKFLQEIPVDHIASGKHDLMQKVIIDWLTIEFPLK